MGSLNGMGLILNWCRSSDIQIFLSWLLSSTSLLLLLLLWLFSIDLIHWKSDLGNQNPMEKLNWKWTVIYLFCLCELTIVNVYFFFLSVNGRHAFRHSWHFLSVFYRCFAYRHRNAWQLYPMISVHSKHLSIIIIFFNEVQKKSPIAIIF